MMSFVYMISIIGVIGHMTKAFNLRKHLRKTIPALEL